MTMTLVRRDPPRSNRTQPQGATTPLDFQILDALRQGDALEVRQVKAQCPDKYTSTHQVHARLTTLVQRGLVERVVNPGGPRRGPGASTYRMVRDG